MADGGETVSYAQLEARSNQGAQLFRRLGLAAGDAISIWMENSARYLEIAWAAHRAGLYFTPVSTHLKAEEAAYLLDDSRSRVLIVGSGVGEAATALLARLGQLAPGVRRVYAVGGAMQGADDWVEARDAMPATRIADETAGQHMVYSSGTTGRPKGVRLPLSGRRADDELPLTPMLRAQCGASEASVYLSPAPLYHTAPLVYCMNMHSIGCTVVVMERFDATAFLANVERFAVSIVQMVPTMFVRLLKLPEAVRLAADTSSLRCVVHAAAPCPVPVKQQMLDWWGPIIYEYYGGSEGNGSTFITPQEWLRKPGSVGKAYWGRLHVCDDAGRELPAGHTGTVYFEGGFEFQYNNDPDKTRESRNPLHPSWSTLGDV
jgi:acyl-CoA synthetase (AMP-forming)/AMP-acid ligase II